MYNGLPSNHVYNTLVDEYGYLWLATPHGVVRYNGYGMKIFDLSTGLPNEDVWKLDEDLKGRIWLSSFSDGIGYLLNDKYHTTILKQPQSLYSTTIKVYNKGISFLFTQRVSNRDETFFFIERNDTLYKYSLGIHNAYWFITEQHKIIFTENKQVYEIAVPTLSKITKKKICNIRDYFPGYYYILQVQYKNFLILYPRTGHELVALNLTDCSCKKIHFNTLDGNKENIFYAYQDFGRLHVMCEKDIYDIDSSLHIVKRYMIDSLTGDINIRGDKVSYIQPDPFWGICLSTGVGAFISNKAYDHFFKKVSSPSLMNYKYVGNSINETGFWWNSSTGTLLALGKGMEIKYLIRKPIQEIRKVVPYSNNYSLILSDNNIFLLENRTGITSQFLPGQYNYSIPFDLVRYDSSNYYILSYGPGRLMHLRIYKDHFQTTAIDNDHYTGIIFDKRRKAVCIYLLQRALILFNNKEIQLDRYLLNRLGIDHLEQVLVDDQYGNIFIKDVDKLYSFDLNNFSRKQLFNNYRLDRASVHIYKDKLILTGSFGVLFSKIEGVSKYSAPILYRNIKNSLYNAIEDVQILNNELLLKTDKGTYLSKIPPDSLFHTKRSGETIQYKFIVNYNDAIRSIRSNDTIHIDQRKPVLQFDVINPLGSGLPKYLYQLDNEPGWHILNANELHLPVLSVRTKYHSLKIMVEDDAWKSPPINVYLYVIPYWWQTSLGKRMIWILSFIVIGLFVMIVILITNRIATNKNTKRNLRLELELKSVYSQINPHFIFNTLGTGLYLIKSEKMEEAFDHISTFSDLLRSYIKSSSNKYITIGEEVVNLTNYIELQLKRFEGKFSYKMIIDDPQTNTINIPSLLLQPLVENAINHGLFHKQEIGFLRIEFNYDRSIDEVICIIEDDGVGRKRSRQINEDSAVKRPSYGSELVKHLINIFNKYENTYISIRYIDKELPLTGTIVKIKIKGKKDGKQFFVYHHR